MAPNPSYIPCLSCQKFRIEPAPESCVDRHGSMGVWHPDRTHYIPAAAMRQWRNAIHRQGTYTASSVPAGQHQQNKAQCPGPPYPLACSIMRWMDRTSELLNLITTLACFCTDQLAARSELRFPTFLASCRRMCKTSSELAKAWASATTTTGRSPQPTRTRGAGATRPPPRLSRRRCMAQL